jgi:predicted small lipoprotein YifL
MKLRRLLNSLCFVMIIVMCLACGRRGEPKIPPPHKTADAFITVKITVVETITRTITYAYTRGLPT